MTKEELRAYKAESKDKNLIRKSCDTCEFNFGDVCAGGSGDEYGEKMSVMKKKYPDGCGSWGISLDAFIAQEKMNGR